MAVPGALHRNRREFGRLALAAGGCAIFPGWLRAAGNRAPKPAPASPGVTGPDSLRAHAAARGLLYGSAVIPSLLDVEALTARKQPNGYTELVAAQAGILVAENAMQWDSMRPAPDTFDFSQADRLFRFAGWARQLVRGHDLCGHSQLPLWFKSHATKENARKLLVDHIRVVAGRYQGQLHSWDVVNEAVEPADGRADGLRKSPWLEVMGPEYIELAFRTAAEADPRARLAYNDYGIELDTAEQSSKRGQVLLLLRRLKARGVPLHAVGVQSHLRAGGPEAGAGLIEFIRECAGMGLEVYITEMDVNTHGLPGGPEAQDAGVARVYSSFLGMVLAEPNVVAVLTWGLTSAHSWLNVTNEEWAKRPDGARQRPLPFDDSLRPTPAFWSLRSALDGVRRAAPLPVQKPVAVPGP
ncbi:MAG: endo-1,4-beta-xylanase [Terracidiphilus sp.]